MATVKLGIKHAIWGRCPPGRASEPSGPSGARFCSNWSGRGRDGEGAIPKTRLHGPTGGKIISIRRSHFFFVLAPAWGVTISKKGAVPVKTGRGARVKGRLPYSPDPRLFVKLGPRDGEAAIPKTRFHGRTGAKIMTRSGEFTSRRLSDRAAGVTFPKNGRRARKNGSRDAILVKFHGPRDGEAAIPKTRFHGLTGAKIMTRSGEFTSFSFLAPARAVIISKNGRRARENGSRGARQGPPSSEPRPAPSPTPYRRGGWSRRLRTCHRC